jgi:hypothetical protein
MKRILLAFVAAFAISTVATAAEQQAKPEQQAKSEPSQDSKRVKLSKEELGKITAGKITEVKVNGGGNTPNGNANGVPSENQNPAGHAPPGQN